MVTGGIGTILVVGAVAYFWPEIRKYPMEINCCCGSVDPTMATLVFVRKSDNMLFYLSDRR